MSIEGADEAFAGYLYFHKAPSARDLHDEAVRKLLALHSYDCLRANKATAAWGVEARVPFLDKDLLQLVMSCDPVHKLVRNGGHAHMRTHTCLISRCRIVIVPPRRSSHRETRASGRI